MGQLYFLSYLSSGRTVNWFRTYEPVGFIYSFALQGWTAHTLKNKRMVCELCLPSHNFKTCFHFMGLLLTCKFWFNRDCQIELFLQPHRWCWWFLDHTLCSKTLENGCIIRNIGKVCKLCAKVIRLDAFINSIVNQSFLGYKNPKNLVQLDNHNFEVFLV